LYAFIRSLGVRDWRPNIRWTSESTRFYGKYIEELFEAWVAADGDVSASIISETLCGALGYRPGTCIMGGTCRNFIGFEPDGVVSPCCEMTLDPQFHFGNIVKTPLREILQGPVAQEFWRLEEKGHSRCGGCPWWGTTCRGGCAYHRIQAGGSPDAKDYLCEAYADVFQRLTVRIDAALSEGMGAGVSAKEEGRRKAAPVCD
jgi:uncharacterized protein